MPQSISTAFTALLGPDWPRSHSQKQEDKAYLFLHEHRGNTTYSTCLRNMKPNGDCTVPLPVLCFQAAKMRCGPFVEALYNNWILMVVYAVCLTNG